MAPRLAIPWLMLWLLACGATALAAPAAPAAPSAAASAPAPASGAAPVSPHAFGKKKATPAPAAPLVDINTASVKQLKTLPGIGDAEASRIVEGRPYRSKADLVTHKVLPAGTYLSLRRLIVAKPSGKPGGNV